ncbi:hypothetical protein CEP52_010794 [Fusarium oligoseptatum]|uniref:SNF2 N-terminal domain-containing protein n=1 Tax=Fusarium oligoseptatum TaxID=2604345 RepID=A0A428T6C7_9HYPO|nr:hypothetical protein CEP52_010794 [Fusarium oligoseptatum]
MSKQAAPSKSNGRAKAEQSVKSSSQPTTSSAKSSKKNKTYNFASIRRPEKAGIQGQSLPEWYGTAIFDVVLPPAPQLSQAERRERQRRHADAKYPPGVFLPKAFLSALGDMGTISQYNAFRNEVDCIAFVEVICPDIFGPAVSVMSSFSKAGPRLSLEEKRFDSLMAPLLNTIQSLSDASETSFPVPPPVEVISAYVDDAAVRDLVDEVARTIPRPVLIPVLVKNIRPNDHANKDHIAQIAFVLIHAVQLLLFSTTQFQQDRTYHREHPERRYTFDTGDKTVAGLFSLEDLNRAVLMMYTMYNRRCTKADAMQKRKPPQCKSAWMGYAEPKYNPALDIPEGTDLLVDRYMSAQLEMDLMILKSTPTSSCTQDISRDGADAFDVYAEILEWSWSSSGPDQVKQRLRESSGIENMPSTSLTNIEQTCRNLLQFHDIDLDRDVHKSQGYFTQLDDALEGQLDQYTATIGDLDQINDFSHRYPGGKEALVAELRHQMAVELTMASLQPQQMGYLAELCERYGLGDWRKPSLYPNDLKVDPYKPHQVFDASTLYLRAARGPYVHTLLSNEMGTGKTRTYLLAVALSVRGLVKEKKEGKPVQFLPSLVVVPPHTVCQTFLEARSQFPDFQLAVFFGDEPKDSPGGIFLRSVHHLVDFVGGLDKDDPKSGRTLILTSWHTLSKRLAKKSSTFFQFKQAEDVPDSLNRRLAAESTSRGQRRPKVKVYFKGQVDDAKIDSCGAAEAHGNLIKYDPKSSHLKEITFQFLIADEAQAAKNRRGSFNHTLDMISWKRLMWVTGTPLSSSLRDLHSPLHLMWNALGGLSWEPTEAELGWLPGLYHQDYDPERENRFGEGRVTRGIFTDEFRQKYPWQVPVLEKKIGSGNCRMWLLSPHLFLLAGRQLQWGSDFASMVVRPIFEVLQLRRTMRTGIMLPNGKMAYPGGENLPMTIYFGELELRKAKSRRTALEKGNSYASRMFVNRDIEQEETTTSPQEAVSSKVEASVNLSVHREALLGTFDERLWNVFHPPSDSEPLLRGTRDDVLKAVRHRREGLEVRSGGPVVGLRHVERIISNDTTHGASFYYYLCREDIHSLAPTDRIVMLRWMAGRSPVAAMALYIALKYVRGEGKRIMFYTDTPWIQQWVITFFAVAGFKVTTIRSRDKASHRNRVIRDWNDPSTDCEVFVANINITATGVNMHGACATGAFLCWHLNFQVMQQAMARLNRIGQKEPVDWWLLKIKGSYHDHIERFDWAKWAIQLSAEVGIPSWKEGAVREICIYEIIKVYIHTPFNRYSWMILRDMFGSGGFDHQGPETVRLGHLLSIVTKLLPSSREQDPTEQSFWVNNSHLVGLACYHLVHTHQDLDDDWETLVQSSTETVRERVRPLMEEAFEEVKGLVEQEDEQYMTWHRRLNKNIDDRKALRSDEFVEDDDEEGEYADEATEDHSSSEDEDDNNDDDDDDDDNDENDGCRPSASKATGQKRKTFTPGSPVKNKTAKRKK